MSLKLKEKLIVGIDPGFGGAIVALADGKVLKLTKMPVIVETKKIKTKTDKGFRLKIIRHLDIATIADDFETLIDISGGAGTLHVIIEKAQAMPSQGSVSTFRYGEGYGALKGICGALRLSYALVHPTVWKRAMLDSKGKGKGASILAVSELYRNTLDGDFIPKIIGKHDGLADALLIARWGRAQLLNDRDYSA